MSAFSVSSSRYHSENINPFKTVEMSHCFQLDYSVALIRVFGRYFTFLFKFHYSVDFIFLSFGVMGFIVEL